MSQGKKCTNNPILYTNTEDNANETVSLEDKFLEATQNLLTCCLYLIENYINIPDEGKP